MAVRSELSLPARIKKARAMERSAKRETAASDDVSTAEKRLKNEAEEVSYVDATCSEIVQPPSLADGRCNKNCLYRA